jgi:hypothetical protein
MNGYGIELRMDEHDGRGEVGELYVRANAYLRGTRQNERTNRSTRRTRRKGENEENIWKLKAGVVSN